MIEREEKNYEWHGPIAVLNQLNDLRDIINALPMNAQVRATYTVVDIVDKNIEFLPDTILGSKRLVGHLERAGYHFDTHKPYENSMTLQATHEFNNGWKLIIGSYRPSTCRIETIEEEVEVEAQDAQPAIEAHTTTQTREVLVCSDESGKETKKNLVRKA